MSRDSYWPGVKSEEVSDMESSDEEEMSFISKLTAKNFPIPNMFKVS
jgi:hypothetical protein